MVREVVLFLCGLVCGGALAVSLSACGAVSDRWARNTNDCSNPRKHEVMHSQVGMLWGYGGKSICTATLVAPDLILTARHCVGRSMVYTRDGWTMIRATPAVMKLDEGPLHDLALLRLERPVFAVNPLPVTKKRPRPGDELRFVGHGCFSICGPNRVRLGTGFKTSIDFPARRMQLAWSSGIGWHACGGDSGGPVINLRTGEIVALVVAGSDTNMFFADPRGIRGWLDD